MIDPKKIIIRLKGGLGNQLFQYAFGLWMADGEKNQIIFDISYFDKDSRHGGFILYELLGNSIPKIVKLQTIHGMGYINFDSYPDRYDINLKKFNYGFVLEGYFQNYKYVESVLNIIKEDFYGNHNNLDYRNNILKMTDSNKVIGLHLRRGDFMNPQVRRAHGIIPENYILSCYRDNHADNSPILFSDEDLNNSFLGYKQLETRISNKLKKDIEEFKYMASCDFLVCSNSTFSYWAGLLSKNNIKSYLPNKWMINGAISASSLQHPKSILYNVELK